MSSAFNARRRQQFLTEGFYRARHAYLVSEGNHWKTAIQAVADNDVENRLLAREDHADFMYMAFSLRYTAGESPETLRAELTEVIAAYELFREALADFEKHPTISPLALSELTDYERCLQLMGLCVLLHRPDLMGRLTSMIDQEYAGEDTLYEDLAASHLPDRADVDEWYHDVPYSELIRSMYADDKKDAARHIETYCRTWYTAFKHAPWHEGHMGIDGSEGDYFGYWVFEAGAVALLCDIDDSAFTHMVYPKDLVAWAREHRDLSNSSQTR